MTIALPWINKKRPFVCLHISHGGYQCYQKRWRNYWHIGLGMGRQFSDKKGWWKWFNIAGRWHPAETSNQ
jgi:hypothetical protein